MRRAQRPAIISALVTGVLCLTGCTPAGQTAGSAAAPSPASTASPTSPPSPPVAISSSPTAMPSPSTSEADAGIPLDPPLDITLFADQRKFPWAQRLPRGGEPLAGIDGQTVCSAGIYAEAPGDRVYLITANHCGDGTFYTHAGIAVGRTSAADPTKDLQVVLLDPAAKPPAYVRHYAGRLPVAGFAESLRPGQRICTTGAISGTKCNLIITNTGTATVDDGDRLRSNLIMVVSDDPNRPATAVGDSGGVAYLVDDGQAFIVGIQTTGQKPVPCGFPTLTDCFQYAFIVDPRPFLATLDAALVTADREPDRN